MLARGRIFRVPPNDGTAATIVKLVDENRSRTYLEVRLTSGGPAVGALLVGTIPPDDAPLIGTEGGATPGAISRANGFRIASSPDGGPSAAAIPLVLRGKDATVALWGAADTVVSAIEVSTFEVIDNG